MVESRSTLDALRIDVRRLRPGLRFTDDAVQMAMLISVAANLDGRLMKPKIEMDRANEMFSQVLTRDQAAEIRHIMNMVTEGGTGTSAMAPVMAAGIRSGGKTGTAQKDVPVIDPKTGEPQKKLVTEHDFKGNIIGQHYRSEEHTSELQSPCNLVCRL